jgi:hypothetical protein
MNRTIWELHAAVFELARARGLREFEVRYADTGDEIEIDLALRPANDVSSPAGERARRAHSKKQCWPMVTKLSLGQQVVYRDLLDLVQKHDASGTVTKVAKPWMGNSNVVRASPTLRDEYLLSHGVATSTLAPLATKVRDGACGS